MINLWAMEKANCRRFVIPSTICFIILFFPLFLNISYIYAVQAATLAGDAETYRTNGYNAQQRGDIDTAIEWYQKAIGIKPDYASPHNDLGVLFEIKGWMDRAEAEYNKALAIDPNYKEVYANLALLYERKGELEKAAFNWMKRYKLGSPKDPWTQEAKNRLEKLGLLDKTKDAKPETEQPLSVEKQIEKEKPVIEEPKAEVKKNNKPKEKKESEWTKVGPANKKPSKKKSAKSKNSMDSELQKSLRLAEERLKQESALAAKGDVGAKPAAVSGELSSSYNRAKDCYNKGEYAKALDIIRIAKQDFADNKQLLALEEEVKFKMKEARIEDYYKEGMIHYRQKDFAGARKEFEAILSILPE